MNAPLLQRARDAMAAQGIDLAPWQFTPLADWPGHERGARAIFRADAAGQASVVLKVYQRRDRAGQVGRYLLTLRERTDHVVRPIFVDPDRGVLAMAHVGQQTALSRLQPEGHDLVLDICSNWLGRFCDDMAPRPLPFDAAAFTAPIVRQCDGLPAPRRALGLRAMGGLEAGLGRHVGGAVPQILSFGDVKPANIVISDTEPRAIAVDPNPDAGPCPPELDLASLIHWGRLIHLRVALRDATPLPRAALLRDIRTAVTAMDHPLDRARLALFGDALMLRAWIRLERLGVEPALRAIFLDHFTGPGWASGRDFTGPPGG